MNIRKLALGAAVSGLALSVASISYAAEAPDDGDHANRPDVAIDGVVTDGVEEFSLDPFAGFGFQGKLIFTLDQIIPQIDSGRQESANANQITFSFVERTKLTGLFNNPTVGLAGDTDVEPFYDEQRGVARDAIGLWDDLIPVDFIEKNGVGADIRFANSADPGQAFAYYPVSPQGYKFASDVFIRHPDEQITNAWLTFGGYGATAIIHEIGHTIGLSHPGAYNGAGATNYANQAEYAQDTNQYSIMSYWDAAITGASHQDWYTFISLPLFPQTPLVHDILTVQAKYGADAETRTGDTVYGYNSTAGRAVFDFTLNPYPNLTIYDAGGNDTLDLSGSTAGVFINLEPGSFSSAAAGAPTEAEFTARRIAFNQALGLNFGTFLPQATIDAIVDSYRDFRHEPRIAAYTGVSGIRATQYDNVSIAYGTIIENAIGSSARDLLWGNSADNVLTGNGGDDVIDGFEGADTYYGGAGYDTFVVSTLDVGDSIADFVGSEDTVDLTAFGGLSFVGGAAFSGVAGELRYDGASLSADLDGDGAADWSMSVGAGLTAANLAL